MMRPMTRSQQRGRHGFIADVVQLAGTMAMPALVVVTCGLSAGCFGDSATVFPAGLEPLEADPVPVQQGGTPTETLAFQSTEEGYISLYGRGYVHATPATVWPLAKNPQNMIALCSTTTQTVTPNDEPSYEFSFQVAYTVDSTLTIDWQEDWRYGTITGTVADPTLAMIRYQKVYGSDFIDLIEGSVEVKSTDDPNVTDVEFVEHLKALESGVADMMKSMQYRFDSLVAAAHSMPQPACP